MPNNVRVVWAAIVKRAPARFPGDPVRVYRLPILIERAEVDGAANPVTLTPEPLAGFVYNNMDWGGLAAHLAADFALFRFVVGADTINETHIAPWFFDSGYGYDGGKAGQELTYRKWAMAVNGGDPVVLDA